MAGLKRVMQQNHFRNKALAVAEKVCGDSNPLTWEEKKPDDAYEDDGVLHVTKHGLHVVFGVSDGESLPGTEVNERIRTILSQLGMKKRIGARTLVEEECEACSGEGYKTCDFGCEHACSDCDGNGYTKPEDYK